MIWLALVAAVILGGGAWLIARSWRTRGVVFLAGLAAALLYLAMGRPDMPDQPLDTRIAQIEKRFDGKDIDNLTAAEVMAMAEKRARENPNDPGPHIAMGVLLELASQPQEAILAYEAALRRAPDEIEAIKRLADLRFKVTTDVDPVTGALYHEWYRRDPDQVRAGFLAGIGDWAQGKKAEAEAIWKEVDTKTPANDPLRGMFAFMRQKYGVDPAPQESQPLKPPG